MYAEGKAGHIGSELGFQMPSSFVTQSAEIQVIAQVAPHLLNTSCYIRTIRELVDHKDVKTTMIYTHVLNRGGHGVCSPIDFL